MILALFLVILAVSILLIAFGEYTEEGVYSLGGLLLLFILGLLVILPGVLTIPNGEIVNYTYVCGCCDDHEFITYERTIFICYGLEHDCDYYDLDQTGCELAGCTYNDTLCSGTPTLCEDYIDLPGCLNAGCDYSFEGQSDDCPNGSVEVVASEIHTPVQEAFNDTLSHTMGFWLCLIAVFGFAIKVSEIKKGFKND